LTIVMEYMHKGSLYDNLHKGSPVPWSMLQKIRILISIARGLESLHRNKIMHRDMKSMNILLDKYDHPKIADLGCSRAFGSQTVRKEDLLTIGIGTPLWMAPEIQTGTYTFSNDMFGFGIIMFEVFNERLPDFCEAKKMATVPKESIGYQIIKQCLHQDPEKRPSAAQAVSRLEALKSSFILAVARFVRSHAQPLNSVQSLPPDDDVDNWYSLLMKYDRSTFDVLLKNALEG